MNPLESIVKDISQKIKKINLNFDFSKKSSLGIDIGTSAIKIVELSVRKNRKILENYGEARSKFLFGKYYMTSKGTEIYLSDNEIADAIKQIIKEANMKAREATFALPDHASFFTHFDLPPMTKEELLEAVKFEARQYIPLPLSEVTLDWQILKEKIISRKQRQYSILLVAVPKRTVDQYEEIAKAAGLEKFALEAEVFALNRSLVLDRPEEKKSICLIDFGSRTTSISIIEKGDLLISRSLDTFSGNILTAQISRSLNISLEEAEELKVKYGLQEQPQNLKTIMHPLVNDLLKKLERILTQYEKSSGLSVDEIILTGGAAKLFGLKEYFSLETKKEVKIANPFEDIFYPPILEDKIRKIANSYSVAVGVACRKIV